MGAAAEAFNVAFLLSGIIYGTENSDVFCGLLHCEYTCTVFVYLYI